MTPFLSKSIPCFLCGAEMDERSSKRRKPYFVCDPCGIQIFIRRKAGIQLLDQLEKSLAMRDALVKPHKLFEFQRLLAELNGTKAQIKKIEDSLGIIFKDQVMVRAIKALRKREKEIIQDLERLAATSDKQSAAFMEKSYGATTKK